MHACPAKFLRRSLRVIATGLALAIAGVVVLLGAMFAINRLPIRFPKPSGPFAVGRTRFYWVEPSVDALAPRAGIPRQLVVSVWYPAQARNGDTRRLSAGGMAGSTRTPRGYSHDRLSDARPGEGPSSCTGQRSRRCQSRTLPGRFAAGWKWRPGHFLFRPGRRSGESWVYRGWPGSGIPHQCRGPCQGHCAVPPTRGRSRWPPEASGHRSGHPPRRHVEHRLVVAAIILRNTVYLARAVENLQAERAIDQALLPHLSPLGWEHIYLTVDYIWHANRRIARWRYRPPRVPKSAITGA